jgi:hypothetical protein
MPHQLEAEQHTHSCERPAVGLSLKGPIFPFIQLSNRVSQHDANGTGFEEFPDLLLFARRLLTLSDYPVLRDLSRGTRTYPPQNLGMALC